LGTSFDDDALQEGLAHGLYGVAKSPAGNPGLGQTLLQGMDDPGTGTVTLHLFKGLDGNLFDHIGLSVNGGHVYGKEPIPGKDYPSLLGTVPGVIKPVAPARKSIDQITLPADADQKAYLLKYLQDRSSPTTYQAETDNCANYLYDALQGAGYKLPPEDKVELPDNLMDEMHKLYDRKQAPLR